MRRRNKRKNSKRGAKFKAKVHKRAAKSRARGGRTVGEKVVAALLKRARVEYVQEYVVMPNMVDFYLPDHHTIIEVDGTKAGSHSSKQQRDRDRRRDERIRARLTGVTIIRFPESGCYHPEPLDELLATLSVDSPNETVYLYDPEVYSSNTRKNAKT